MQPENSTPKEIKLFERLNLGALAIGIVVAALTFEANRAMANATFVLLVQGAVFIFLLFLIFWISRWRSNIGRWIWTILMVVGMVPYIPALIQMLKLGLPGFLSIIQLVLELVGIYLLFTPASRQWFRLPKDQPQTASSSQTR